MCVRDGGGEEAEGGEMGEVGENGEEAGRAGSPTLKGMVFQLGTSRLETGKEGRILRVLRDEVRAECDAVAHLWRRWSRSSPVGGA